MATFPIKYIYEIVDRYTPAAKRMAKATKNFKSRIHKAGLGLKAFSKKMKKIGKDVTNFGKSLSLKLTAPLVLLGGMALRASAQFETMRTSFVGILGDADKAGKLVDKLAEFTAKTPFQLEQVASSAKKLLAAGFSDETISDQLQLLGDLSAAANVPLNDMASIFAKIKNKGKAMTEEILQMSDRGIPIIAELAKQFGTTKEQVFELAQSGKITFPLITRTLRRMTREGGFAHKAMILQSKTLSGIISTLRDNLFLLGKQIGDVFLEDMKKLAISTIEIAQATVQWIKNNPRITKMALIVAGLLATLGPVLIIVGQMAIGVAVLAKSVVFLGGGLGLIVKMGGAILSVGKIVGVVISALASIPGLPILAFLGSMVFLLRTVVKHWQGLKELDVGLVFRGILITFEETFPKIFGFMNSLIGGFSKIKSMIGGAFGGSDLNVNSNATQNFVIDNQASVDINLNSLPGVVQSVATRGDFVSVGMNMKPAQ